MTTISLNIPNGAPTQAVLDAFTGTYDYQPMLPDPNDPTGTLTITNPETPAAFSKRMIADYVKDTVKKWQIRKAQQAAAVNTAAQIDASVVIT